MTGSFVGSMREPARLLASPLKATPERFAQRCSFDLAGQPTIVTGSSDGSVCRFDAREGTLIGEPVVLHLGGIRSVAIGRLGETQVVVSANSDCTRPRGAPTDPGQAYAERPVARNRRIRLA